VVFGAVDELVVLVVDDEHPFHEAVEQLPVLHVHVANCATLADAAGALTLLPLASLAAVCWGDPQARMEFSLAATGCNARFNPARRLHSKLQL
jgi:hypothetical protein